MSWLTNKERIGFWIAPVIAPIVALVETLTFSIPINGWKYSIFSSAEAFGEMIGIITLYVILGSPIAYTITLVIGLPIYLFFKNKKSINFWSVSFWAAFVSVFPLLVMSAPRGFDLYSESSHSSISFYLAIAFCGYVSGLVFWLIANPIEENT